MKLTYDNFKFYVGETIEFCQTIENDVKWIYSAMLKGDRYETYDNISGWTLGKVVGELEKLDNSDNNRFLSDNDYDLLRSITNERNYLIHQIFRDFIYEENFINSNKYQVACSRLMNFHNRVKKLQNSVENVRLKAVNYYKK